MTRGMSELCGFPSLDGCQKRFLRVHKEVDLVVHPVVGRTFQGGDAQEFPQALDLESLDLEKNNNKKPESASLVHMSLP